MNNLPIPVLPTLLAWYTFLIHFPLLLFVSSLSFLFVSCVKSTVSLVSERKSRLQWNYADSIVSHPFAGERSDRWRVERVKGVFVLCECGVISFSCGVSIFV